MSNPTVVQFGTSRFLQAHADLFFAECWPDAQPVTVVQSSGDPSRAGRVQALTRGYDLRIRGLQAGAPVDQLRRVSPIARGLCFGPDMAEVQRLVAEEADMILSNTADAGFRPCAADAGPKLDPAMSYPAKLAHLLRGRFEAGARGLQVMPTELVRNNGDTLRGLVLDAASAMDRAYRAWLTEEVVWVNSLVDRIVSEPLYPAGAIAEPYALWAMEAQRGLQVPCPHPSIEVVPDLGVIERRKLFVLNLGHSWMVSTWLAAGRQGAVHVRDVMADPDWAQKLRRLYAEEVVPAFAAAGEEAGLAAYIDTTMERFANPFLAHRLEDIAQNHTEKLQRRIGAFLAWAADHGDRGAKPGLHAAMEGD
ncbi:mannitol dehydrogenase family protein [Phaeobacter sp. B1627]|uniref:mannitol dehydrogenase family protein n=1 Tax=Phaeobacter sp. B1627 TaxID=2583809 RepID=UPI0011187129|nr:mannitol dehydrogenase family protein [Phaeobacter sp. B1627]TNJ40819.1 mannitol dehydrogenase family protein [Phaeobacter sp. B1627]